MSAPGIIYRFRGAWAELSCGAVGGKPENGFLFGYAVRAKKMAAPAGLLRCRLDDLKQRGNSFVFWDRHRYDGCGQICRSNSLR